MKNDRWKFAWAWFIGAVLLLLPAVASAQVSDFSCPDGSCSFFKDSHGRTIVGFGVRPTADQTWGLTMGTPFYDGPTYQWYWWTGTTWTASLTSGTQTSPTITNPTITGAVAGSSTKTLTDAAAAAAFVRIAVPTNGAIGGDVIYTAISADGTNGALARQARWSFAGADKAGTVTCGVGAEVGAATAYSRANTLTCTMSAATATTNCDLKITCTDNKAGDQAVTFYWRLDTPIAVTYTPQ